MKSIFVLAALARSVCWGQTSGDCNPSALNVPEAKYPCVYPDHRAMFRVIAPNAQKVTVRVGQGFDMTKGPDGIWSATTTPLVEGFHYYTLQIDGATVADPSTMTFFGSGWENSGIEIPAADADFYAAKQVPHGHVSEQSYFSTVTGKWRRAFVYTPPDYSYEYQGPLSGPISAARMGRGRNRLGHAGAPGLHHGQSDRGRESEAHDRGDGQSQRRKTWRKRSALRSSGTSSSSWSHSFFRSRSSRSAGSGRAWRGAGGSWRRQLGPTHVHRHDVHRFDPYGRTHLQSAAGPRESRHGGSLHGRLTDVFDGARTPR